MQTRANEVAERFGKNLVRCRRRARISQEELGFRADLHRTEIGMLERGIRLARIDTLIKLMGALEVSADELLAGMGWQPINMVRGSFDVDFDMEANDPGRGPS
ncbi:MAG TPA: helix-turn-helix transcriptional regulator [Solirubrobacterales bacterium]|jgi:transcriptional regulator with XRE-family HTH domain|nr:helix-turn-helix transcriptional regulator [Solirubrobacterales bacterium]